jgi:hypothetical protein
VLIKFEVLSRYLLAMTEETFGGPPGRDSNQLPPEVRSVRA